MKCKEIKAKLCGPAEEKDPFLVIEKPLIYVSRVWVMCC